MNSNFNRILNRVKRPKYIQFLHMTTMSKYIHTYLKSKTTYPNKYIRTFRG